MLTLNSSSLWDGVFGNYTTQKLELIKDGLYSVELLSLGTDGIVYSDYATIPFFVKTKAPIINTSADVKISGKNNPALTGTIDDLYVTAPAMWDEWTIDFDVSEWLDATYVIKEPIKRWLSKALMSNRMVPIPSH